jgi:hypothetical protein
VSSTAALQQTRAANEPDIIQAMRLMPSRFITIKLFATVSGYTEPAVNMKIYKGEWLEDREYVRRDGRVLIDLQGYEKWAKYGRA